MCKDQTGHAKLGPQGNDTSIIRQRSRDQEVKYHFQAFIKNPRTVELMPDQI